MTYCIIGYGRVGYHLHHLFQSLGHISEGLFSRSASGDNQIQVWNGKLPPADFVFITTNDSVVEQIATSISSFDGIVLHCSGSLPIDILPKRFPRAVLYPLQTFSRERKITYSDIPFFIETEDEQSAKKIEAIFPDTWRRNIHRVSYEQRLYLHVSAVWACNFTNHLMTISEKILQFHDLDFNLLKPLIHETIEKLDSLAPKDAQTGPAFRKDFQVIERHIHLLSKSFPEYAELYRKLTQSIIQTHYHE